MQYTIHSIQKKEILYRMQVLLLTQSGKWEKTGQSGKWEIDNWHHSQCNVTIRCVELIPLRNVCMNRSMALFDCECGNEFPFGPKPNRNDIQLNARFVFYHNTIPMVSLSKCIDFSIPYRKSTDSIVSNRQCADYLLLIICDISDGSIAVIVLLRVKIEFFAKDV